MIRDYFEHLRRYLLLRRGPTRIDAITGLPATALTWGAETLHWGAGNTLMWGT